MSILTLCLVAFVLAFVLLLAYGLCRAAAQPLPMRWPEDEE